MLSSEQFRRRRNHPQDFSLKPLRDESGRSDYKTSRACKVLEGAGLIRLARAQGDGRRRVLIPTDLEKRVLNRILKGAGQWLWDSIEDVGRLRRIHDATEHLRAIADFVL